MADANKQLDLRQLSVLITALMATGIGQSLVFAILAPLGREVNLGELQITSIIAVSALVFALASPHWGRFSDRVGRKPVIITGLLGYTLGTLLFTSVFYAGLAGMLSGLSLYATLLLSRCLQGVVMSGTNPSSTAYAADNSSRHHRTRTMARLGTANSLGTILGPAVSGVLATFGLLAPLYFAAGLAALAAILVWKGLPPTPPQDLTRRAPRPKLRVADPRIRHYLIASVGLFTGYSSIQQTLGFMLQDRLNLSGIETAQMTGAALMVSALFTLTMQLTVMQRLKLSSVRFLRLAMVALLAGAGFVASFDHFAVLAVGMACIGTGLGMGAPSASAGASLSVTPEEQGAAAGLITACPGLGFVAGPICAGFLYQVYPPLAPLFSASVFFLVLAYLTLVERQQVT